MKARAGDIQRILKSPPAEVRLMLIYGPDGGLVAARARAAERGVLGEGGDPFRSARVSDEQLLADPPRLADEFAAMALTGGHRVVRIQPAGDRLTSLLKPLMAKDAPGDALLLAVAGELSPRSSLRKLAEASPAAVAIPCYADDAAARRRLILAVARDAGWEVEEDALAYGVEHMGADHGISLQELEKLRVYMGPAPERGGRIGLEDMRAVIGDSGAWHIADIADDMLLGRLERLERNFNAALQAGVGGVGVLNVVASAARRTHGLVAAVDGGAKAVSVVAGARPPIPFFRRDVVVEQMRRWSRKGLDRALAILSEAELACKKAGAPDVALARQAIWRIASHARGLRVRR